MRELVDDVPADTAERAFTAEELSHGFDGDAVLATVNLSVGRGETLAIIGPSGTGKTTLLRLLAMFEPPESGHLRLDGRDLWAISERERLQHRRRIAMVFQEPNLFTGSVRRNVAYGRLVRKTWRERLDAAVRRILGDPPEDAVGDVLDLVGMGTQLEDPVAELSGGERQRVAFARAVACDPAYLLLDEPTSDLDPRNTAVIEEAIGKARDRGIGVVVATHDMHQAERVADRVAVLIGGELIEIGSNQRIFHAPRDDRVRQFIDGELVY